MGYAETAMKIDHLNQFKELVLSVVSLSVEDGNQVGQQALTIEDSLYISDIISNLNSQEGAYDYFLKELKNCWLYAKSLCNENWLVSHPTGYSWSLEAESDMMFENLVEYINTPIDKIVSKDMSAIKLRLIL